uniref:C2 domain-containing protein 5-like n=1 Tax=Sinocyclocheilus anshuiensis TaxID=1608454 RepID=A0A671KC23_9TELE
MDRASDLTDAFVEVKFGNTTFKTDVYPKSLNPQWNSEWFKFEVRSFYLSCFRLYFCGVYSLSTSIPRCYRAIMVHGFVEELVVNEDPEYQWIDRIRTPRASNEARQRLIFLMSGELQRKIGLKVLEMGGNAVVGYLQCFDLEGESGLVVRAIGTACTLEKISTFPATATYPSNSSPSKDMKE